MKFNFYFYGLTSFLAMRHKMHSWMYNIFILQSLPFLLADEVRRRWGEIMQINYSPLASSNQETPSTIASVSRKISYPSEEAVDVGKRSWQIIFFHQITKNDLGRASHPNIILCLISHSNAYTTSIIHICHLWLNNVPLIIL